MYKGYLCHLLTVKDLEHEVPCIDFVSVVNIGFGKKGKFRLRYKVHYESLQQVGKITERLVFYSSVFHVSML